MKEKIEKILGRPVEVIPVNYKGKKVFLVEYFNYTFRNNISDLYGDTEEEALEKLYKILGDTNGTDTASRGQPSEEDTRIERSDGNVGF